jgi:hypothetical protein
MSLKGKKDGTPTGVKGVVTAASMRAAIGGARAVEPDRAGKVPDSPVQARLRAEGKHREADALTSPDFAVSQMSEAEVYAALGKPALAPPPGSPDGTPVPLPPRELPRRHQRQEDGAAMNGPTPEESAAEIARDAAEALSRDAVALGRKQIARSVAVMEKGSPAERAATMAEVNETMGVVKRTARLLGF